MSSEDPDWRQCLLTRLRERNRRESLNYKDLISQLNRLLDHNTQLKSDNLKLSVENEQLRTAAVNGGTGKDATATQLAIAALEKKLLTQQEELTELHKRKGENAQLILDLNVKTEKQNQIIAEKDKRLAEQQSVINCLRAEVQMLKSSLEELKKLNSTMLDEHTSLQLEFSSLEEKLRTAQSDNHSLLERLMRYKSKDAEKLNEENECFLRKRSDKLKRELEDAVRESQAIDEDSVYHLGSNNIGAGGADYRFEGGEDFNIHSSPRMNTHGHDFSQPGGSLAAGYKHDCNPTDILMKFEAHEAESHAVRWSPVERMLATGGADRKVKLWDVYKGAIGPRAVLGGSSAGINSVDFDSTGSYILGTSNDYGARVWSVSDNRLRHTLTGHSGKVMTAKYLQEPIKVVTGSHDRTLKVWDLRSIACIETKFAGSSCNDLVTTDSLGSTIISGHYDKKVRFWDMRTEKQVDDVLMPAKVTSLCLSCDCHYLICSVRDDTIKLLDLRKNQVMSTYTDDNFKLSCDWARASFNMNGSKIACGSADGKVYIWSINGRLEATLEGHSSNTGLFQSDAVIAVDWSPKTNCLASVGKGKRCIVYTD